MKITITRHPLPDDLGTFGVLETENGFKCYTMENPWLDNKRSESCIPNGWYVMKMRQSPIVERTSRGEFKEGWEVTNVVGRQFIMFHVGNWTRDTDGCILTGRNLSHSPNGFMVTHSIATFRQFMHHLDIEDSHVLQICR